MSTNRIPTWNKQATIIRLRMHRDWHGPWADSPDVEGWTVTGRDALEVMQLAGDAVVNHPELLGLDSQPDVRWQWCDDPTLGVVAVRMATPLSANDPQHCGCASECRS